MGACSGRHYSSVTHLALIASQELVMFDYQRVTARIDSSIGARTPLFGTLSSLILIGLLAACSGGKNARDDAAAPPPPLAEESAPAPAVEPTAEVATAQAMDQPNTGEPVVLNTSAPQKYVVRRGDTLWDIARQFLRDPWFWPEIWYVNPQIENPHLIYPGDELSLGVGADGKPQVTLTRGVADRMSPQMRSQPLEDAIKAIPYEIVASFMSRPSVLEKEQIKTLPYVLAGRDEHIVHAAGNEIYIKGLNGTQNARYNIVQVGEPLVDPDDNKVVGYQGIYAATGRLVTLGSLAKLELTDSARETRNGDKVVSDALDVPLDFVPHTPETQVSGRIISVIDGVTNIGQYQVVVINRGSREGLAPGHVLGVFQRGDLARDPAKSALSAKVRLPDERAGTFMVFKTFDRISYGLIMEADHALHIGDNVGNP